MAITISIMNIKMCFSIFDNRRFVNFNGLLAAFVLLFASNTVQAAHTAEDMLQISLQATFETCTGSSDAKVDVVFDIPTVGPYTYLWSDGSTNWQLNDVGAGPHSVTVTDAAGATAEASIEVQLSPEGVWVMTSSTDATCGQANGTAYANAMTGTPPFTYLWSNGSTSNNPTGLTPGTYIVTVTDANGCTNSETAVVNDSNSNFEINLQATYETCAGSADAKVDVVFVTRGTDPYTYLWSNGSTNWQLNDVGAGPHSVTVTDATGCTATASIDVELSPEGVWIMTSTTDATCGQANGTAYVGAMTGTPPYTYLWSNGNTTNNPTGLVPGTYTVTVTDANGCTNSETAVVNGSNDSFDINLQATYETCTGSSDAKIDVVFVTQGTDPYTYLWSDGSTFWRLDNVSAGNYSVTVTDATGCTATASIDVELSPEGVWIMVSGTDADCGQNNGTAKVSPMTGTPPYTYLWSNGGTTESISGLGAGTYSVTVTDANGCSAVDQITINGRNAPDAGSISTTDPTTFCVGDGIPDLVNVTSTGNTAPNFTYVITDSNGIILNISSTPPFDFDAAPPGNCLIWGLGWEGTLIGADIGANANDIQGCFDLTDPITVIREDCSTPCDANAGSLTAARTPVCLIGASVNISATPDGNAVVPAGYQILYVLTSGSGLVIEQTSSTPSFDVSSIGLYTIHTLVYDPNTLDLSIVVPGTTTGFDVNALLIQGGGMICAALDVTGAPIVVEACKSCSTPVLSNVVVVEATCGNSDGRATVNVAGDPTIYTYTWSPNVSTTFTATNIPAGTYSVTIADPADPAVCNLVEVFTVRNVDGPQAEIVQTTPATCNEANGTATLSPINFTYEWCNGAMGNNVTNLPSGKCTVTVTDPATNCQNFIEVVIDEINPLMATPRIDRQPDCNMVNGEVTIEVSGGSFNYTYAWSDGGSGATRTNLSSGVYNVTVTDNGPTGCVTVTSFVLTDDVPGVTVDVDALVFTSCPNTDDGNATFTVTPSPGFAGPAQTVIKDSNGNVVTNGTLSPGNYCIEVMDANGCVAGGACFEVRYPSQIDVDVTLTNKECTADGSILLAISGGTGPYVVDWDDLAGNNDPEDRLAIVPGTYAFTVTDANGCTAVESNLVITDECDCTNPVVNSVVIIEATCGNSDGSVTINMVPVQGVSFTFDWNPPVASDNQASNVAAGIYAVTITDPADAQCSIVERFTIGNSDGPDTDLLTDPASCGGMDGMADFSPANFNYLWEDGFVGAFRSDLAEGRYFVEITDPADPTCKDYRTVQITTSGTLRGSATVNKKPTCNSADGDVLLTASGGSSNYTFTWQDNFVGNTRGNLRSGTYVVTITDDANMSCSTTLTFTLDDDVPLAEIFLSSTSVSTSCKGSNDGSLVITPILSAGFVGPSTLTIVDGAGNTYSNGNLPPGDYCVIIRDGNNCLAGSSCFSVTDAEQIDIDFAVADAGCQTRGSILVTEATGGTGNFFYDWVDLPGSDNIRDRVDLSPGTYVCLFRDENRCERAVTFEIDGPDNMLMVEAMADSVSNCDGTISLGLSGMGGTIYTWLNSADSIVSRDRDPRLTITNDEVFVVVVEDGFGCTDSDTIQVLEAAISAEINAPSLGCEGSDLSIEVMNLDAGDTLSYNWTPVGSIIDGATTATPSINTTVLGETTYYVTITNQYDCELIDSVTIGIADTSLNAALIATNQCEENLINFTVDSTVNLDYYVWDFGDPTTMMDTDTGNVVSYTYPGPGFYTVLLTLPDGTGCPTDTVRKEVEVLPVPLSELDFDFDYTACADTAVIVFSDSSSHNGSDIIGWQWIVGNGDPVNGDVISVPVRDSGDLDVTLITLTASGCRDTITRTVTIDLIDDNLESPLEECPDIEVALNPDFNSGYEYSWEGNGIVNTTDGNPLVNPDGDETYSVTITDPETGCVIEKEITLDRRTDLEDFEAQSDTLTCDNLPIDLITSGTGVTGYLWSDDPLFGSTLGTGASQQVTPGERGEVNTYYVRGTDQFNCIVDDTVNIVNRSVSFEIAAEELNVCAGETRELEITVILAADEQVSVVWDPADLISPDSEPGFPIIVAPQSDTRLSGTATNQFGCSGTDEVEVVVVDLETVATIEALPDTVCQQGEEIQLLTVDDPSYDYQWSSTGNGTLDQDDIYNPMARPGAVVNPGNQQVVTYTVTITDENQCTAERSIDITVIIPDCVEPWIFFPNAFTPNNDGRNDVLRPRGFNIDEVNWIVYNRWGEKMFEGRNLDDTWDGTFNGENLSSDVYGYYLRVVCIGGQVFEKQGNVTLIR